MTTASPFVARSGEGVPPLMAGELKKGIMKRIERLGKMNDRRLKYVAGCERMGLLKLADEYETLGHYGCPSMAAEIRREAQEV